jgi:hypothetical protein
VEWEVALALKPLPASVLLLLFNSLTTMEEHLILPLNNS